MNLPLFGRIGFTLLLALAAALLCVFLKTPLPWMIGPLLATAIAGMLRAPVRSWTVLRNGGQWVIGAALGLYFTSEVMYVLSQLWWVILAAIVWSLGLGTFFSAWLRRRHPETRGATAYFAGAIGGASEMTLLSKRYGARTDLVAAAHSLRVVLVTLLIPFAMRWSGVHGFDISPLTTQHISPQDFLLLALATGSSIWLMLKLKRANPWFLGALLAAILLTANSIVLTAIPRELSNAAQLVIGISLGVRFTPDFVRNAPRWLFSVTVGTLLMISFCAFFAWLVSLLTNLHIATMILATAPGGIAEMAITAKVLQLGVPVVTTFQVCRLIVVLILTEPIYRQLFNKSDPSTA